MAGSLARISYSLFGGAAFAAVVAAAEAHTASRALGTGPAFGTLFLADLGLLAPAAFGLSLATGLALVFLEPERPRSLPEIARELRCEPVLLRARTAAALPLSVFALLIWTCAMAHAARAELAAHSPLLSGLRLALEGLSLASVLVLAVLAALPAVRRLLAYGADVFPRLLDPVFTGAVAFGISFVALALGVGVGDTGGDGPGPFAVFGVLKRNELDLRPAVNVLAIVAGAYLGPLALAQRRRSPGIVVAAFGLALVPFVLTVRAATVLDDDPALTRALESFPPLGKLALRLIRRVTDRDHDGASPHFGGGDCDDENPSRSPTRVDLPDNGVDEDCSGTDEIRSIEEPEPPPHASAESEANPFPENLNLVLLTIDTLRTDVGFMGYPLAVTPHLDRLAEKSVVFDRAYAFASYTGKSVGPFLVGKYPSETARDGGHFNRYAASNVFVAERLRAAGVRTFGGGAHWYFGPAFGLTQGMDVWDMSAKPPSGQGDNDTSVTSERLANAAIRLLSKPENVNVRFFAWFHFVDPHAQYVPHPEAPDFLGGRKNYAAAMRAAYDGEVWYTDAQVGRILDYVATQPWGARTAIIVTADHGEAFGEHNMNWHGFEIWDVLVRVPFLVYVPGVRPHRVPAKRSHIDLVPNILDVMHVEAPPKELSGTSLRRDLLAVENSSYEERDVYVDMPDGPHTRMRRALVFGPTPGTKIVHSGGAQYQLYDLATDPREQQDLARDKNALGPAVQALARFRARLREIEVTPETPAPK